MYQYENDIRAEMDLFEVTGIKRIKNEMRWTPMGCTLAERNI